MPFFFPLLGALSMAMVYAMVQYSRAVLEEGASAEDRRAWGRRYLLTWIALLVLLGGFVREESPPGKLRANAVLVVAVAGGWLLLHFAILRFGLALRAAALRDREPARDERFAVDPERFEPEAEEEEEEDAEVPPPSEPTRLERFIAFLRATLRWIVSLAVVLLVIGIGENLEPLRRFDRAIAPHRKPLTIAFALVIGAGFATFMTGIIRLVLASRVGDPPAEMKLDELKRRWREGTLGETERTRNFVTITSGVAVALGGAILLGLVAGRPGLKLLVIAAAAWIAYHTWRAFRAA